ncbi:MAG: hypothetical protein ACWGOX_05840 [Desulforhopalus sp.]
MSIRALAKEVYRAQQKFDKLEKASESAAAGDKDGLKMELTMARNELAILRRMLDAEKESGKTREKFTGFGRSKM